MKFGVNSVLFGGFDLATAFRCAALAGYEGIELSAIDGMSEHLLLDRWQQDVSTIKALAQEHNLKLLAIEQPSLDPDKMHAAFQAAAALEIPIVNCGPGGKTGDEHSLQESIQALKNLAAAAERHGVTLCVKAHVGCAIHDTPTTLRAIEALEGKGFGIDFDPSHILRAGEDPVAALQAVIGHVRHIHIRDCSNRAQGPGKPEEQTPGRGDVDLCTLLQTLKVAHYKGPIDLEIIGARDYPLEACTAIAAEARGYLRACR